MSVAVALRALVPVAGALAVLMAPIEMAGHARSALAIAVAMVLSWIVEVLHPAIVGFIGAFLFRATGDVDFETAFAGFGTATPWFLYGVLLLFSAVDRAGVLDRMGAATPRRLTASLPVAAVVLMALAYALTMVVPGSLARATMLAMLAVAWARRAPAAQVGARSVSLVLVATYSSVMFDHAEMPGGPEALVGWDVAAAIAVLVGAVVWLPARDAEAPGVRADATTGAPVLDLRIAALLAVAAALWLTAPLHRVPPDLVGLGAGLVCCLPGMNRAEGRSPATADPLALIVAGTALSIPAVLIETTAADALSHFWLTTQHAAAMLPQELVAYWSTTAYRLFSPETARVALPALDGVSSPNGAAATWAYAGGTLLSLHQSPALILGMSVGGCRARHVLAVGMCVLVAGSVVVLIF